MNIIGIIGRVKFLRFFIPCVACASYRAGVLVSGMIISRVGGLRSLGRFIEVVQGVKSVMTFGGVRVVIVNFCFWEGVYFQGAIRGRRTSYFYFIIG